jgi:hypothetical protein
VPQALAGFRPNITAVAVGGEQSLSATEKFAAQSGLAPGYVSWGDVNRPFFTGLTITQSLPAR